MAASLPSARVIRVCHTMVVRPLCSGVVSVVMVSPIGQAAKKLVLLSTVVVPAPSGRLRKVAVPPMLSASAITAPPCSTPLRLASSSRTTSSATTRSGAAWVIFMPSQRPHGGWPSARSVSFISPLSPHGEERGVAARLEPWARKISAARSAALVLRDALALILSLSKDARAPQDEGGTGTSPERKRRGGRRASWHITEKQPCLLRLRDDAQIGARRLPAGRILLLGVIVRHRARSEEHTPELQ